MVRAAARRLSRRGLREGDTAGIFVADAVSHAVGVHAVRAAGAIAVPVRPAQTAADIAAQLEPCPARVLITSADWPGWPSRPRSAAGCGRCSRSARRRKPRRSAPCWTPAGRAAPRRAPRRDARSPGPGRARRPGPPGCGRGRSRPAAIPIPIPRCSTRPSPLAPPSWRPRWRRSRPWCALPGDGRDHPRGTHVPGLPASRVFILGERPAAALIRRPGQSARWSRPRSQKSGGRFS